MVTFSRIVAGEAGMLEITITLAVLLATIAVLNAVTSRIYVNGVMNYSDKVKFKDLAEIYKASIMREKRDFLLKSCFSLCIN